MFRVIKWIRRQRQDARPLCKNQALSIRSITHELCADKCRLRRWKGTPSERELVGKADVSLYHGNSDQERHNDRRVIKWMATGMRRYLN